MKGDEMDLFVQLLLESRTGAYIEWIDNELIMTTNNNINKDSLLLLLYAKTKLANHKAYHIPWSREIIPTSRISLMSTLCTLGLLPLLQAMLEEYCCVKDSSSGHRRILVHYR